MDDGDYVGARVILEKIKGYEDAQDLIAECDNAISYAEGVLFMQQGQYGQAQNTFDGLEGYRDSQDKSEECGRYIDYAAAEALLGKGDFEAARDAFAALGGFQDSAERVDECVDGIDDLAWAKAASRSDMEDASNVLEDAIAAVEGYMGEWPEGRHVADAADRRDNLYWLLYQRKDTQSGYEEYLGGFPDGKFRKLAQERIDELVFMRQSADFQAAKDAYTVGAVQTFLETWPNGELADQAKQLIETIRADGDLSAAILNDPANAKSETLAAFLERYPGHKDQDKVKAIQDGNTGYVQTLAKNGVLSVSVSGISIGNISVKLTNKTVRPAKVTIGLGTYFAANSGGVMDMVLLQPKSLSLDPGASETLNMLVAGMNISRDIPGSSNDFTLSALNADSKLAKLVVVLADNGCTYAVSQAAVWIVQDNPGDSALLNTLENQDGSQTIKQADLDKAKTMVAKV